MRTATKTSAATTHEPDYELLMTRLVAVVDRLESGELSLADALALYEEGVGLGAACQRVLEAAELRVQQLTVATDGTGAS